MCAGAETNMTETAISVWAVLLHRASANGTRVLLCVIALDMRAETTCQFCNKTLTPPVPAVGTAAVFSSHQRFAAMVILSYAAQAHTNSPDIIAHARYVTNI